MQTLNIVAKELFNKIRGRFPSVTIGDGEGNVTTTPEQARFYDFDFITEGRAVGKISISLDENTVSVVYNQGLVTNEDSLTKESWYNFLKELRQFAKKRMLNFDTRDINKSNLNRRDYKFLANNRTEEETMSEGKLYGTSRLSYQDFDGARLVLRHNQAVNQERAAGRTQNVESIYIESAEGERFKYPYKHINGARAMARHVAEGGNAYDEFGKHIVGLSEELSKLKKFKSYMSRSNVMAEGLSGYVDVVKERLTTVKKTIESLQKKAYYTEAFESFEKTEVTEVPQDVAENWIDELTIRQFNEELKDVFPYIYNLVSENTRAETLGPMDLEGYEVYQGDMRESGLQYHTGVKKHGKEYMVKAAKAGREGASQEELGALKDKYSKAEKNKKTDEEMSEGPFKGIGKMAMKRKLNKQYKKSDLANFDDSGMDTSGKTPDEIRQMKSDYYHDHMDKADKAKKAGNRLSREEMEIEAAFEQTMGQFGEVDTNEAQDGQVGTMALFVSDQDGGEHEVEVQVKIVNGKPEIDPNTLPGPEDMLYWDDADIEQQAMDAMRDGDIEFDESFDPQSEPSKQEMELDKLNDVYEKGGEAGLAKEIGLSPQELDREMSEYGMEHGLHMDDDRDDIIQGYIEELVDNMDEGNAYAHAVKKAKMNGKKKGDKIDGPDGDEITLEKDDKTPLGEFILSYFDKETGEFPKGETAVLTMVEKDYGEQFIEPAKAFITKVYEVTETYREPAQTPEFERMRELAGLR